MTPTALDVPIAAEAAPAAPHEEPVHGHHSQGFVRRYIFSTDHKIIGIQYLVTAMDDRSDQSRDRQDEVRRRSRDVNRKFQRVR